MDQKQMKKFLEGIPPEQIEGRNLVRELEALKELIPEEFLRPVHEGGGAENLLATLAVSLTMWGKK